MAVAVAAVLGFVVVVSVKVDDELLVAVLVLLVLLPRMLWAWSAIRFARALNVYMVWE